MDKDKALTIEEVAEHMFNALSTWAQDLVQWIDENFDGIFDDLYATELNDPYYAGEGEEWEVFV